MKKLLANNGLIGQCCRNVSMHELIPLGEEEKLRWTDNGTNKAVFTSWYDTGNWYS